MTANRKHITVCICTFKRPELLMRLLGELDRQETEKGFSYSVVVADNDSAQSAKPVVSDFAARSAIDVVYAVEPVQNIALARNKAMAHAKGDFIAFIDDDEHPPHNWLLELFKIGSAEGIDGVMGPVIPYFDEEPPRWAVNGRFFERPTHETGYKVPASEARTGNVMFRKNILDATEPPFRAEFGTGGEDSDFFARMMEKGCIFLWCNEAVVYEAVPPTRCKRAYLLKRALRCGNNSFNLPVGRLRNLIKSFVAVPLYALALPWLYVAGDHHFMKYMIKFCDHAGRLLALLRIRPFDQYR